MTSVPCNPADKSKFMPIKGGKSGPPELMPDVPEMPSPAFDMMILKGVYTCDRNDTKCMTTTAAAVSTLVSSPGPHNMGHTYPSL